LRGRAGTLHGSSRQECKPVEFDGNRKEGKREMRYIKCPRCQGDRKLPGEYWPITCPKCKGEGYIPEPTHPDNKEENCKCQP